MVMSRRVVIIDWSGDMRVAIAHAPGQFEKRPPRMRVWRIASRYVGRITPGSHQPHSIFAPDASRMAVHFGISAFT